MTCSCGCHDRGLPCGCCEGIETLTPMPTANRPGLDAIAYRIGTHATFLESMMARLSSLCLDDEGQPCVEGSHPLYPLRDLSTRDPADPAIAFLDAWATVGDVLTFYQERIANEGYLRTAIERRSVLELARLVGYRPRPGVAASVYLAFTLEDTHPDEVIIPAGTRAQSLPTPPDLPQSFETGGPLAARAVWNRLRPRLYRQQIIAAGLNVLYVEGTGLGLRAGDRILIAPPVGDPELRIVARSKEDFALQQTTITLAQAQERREMVALAAGAPEAVLPAAPIGTALPGGLGAAPLKALKDGLAELGAATPEQLDQIATRFAATLIDTFKLLTTLPPSSKRDQAIAAHKTTLREIDALLFTMAERTPENALLRDPLRWMADRTRAALDALATPSEMTFTASAASSFGQNGEDGLDRIVNVLAKGKEKVNVPPPTPYHLPLDKTKAFALTSDLRLRVTGSLLHNDLRTKDLYQAIGDYSEPPSPPGVFALRTTAAPFGHNAGPRPDEINPDTGLTTYDEWAIDNPLNTPPNSGGGGPVILAQPTTEDVALPPLHNSNLIFLDAEYDLAPESRVVINSPVVGKLIFFTAGADNVQQRSVVGYGLSGKSTALGLTENWFPGGTTDFSIVRNTRVYLQSDTLPLGLEPLPEEFPSGADEAANEVVLDGFYDGLEPGRWLIVAGERADIPGVWASELVMLQNVSAMEFDGSNGAVHTVVTFDNKLLYPYRRQTMVIYANVARATHGETTTEALGSGGAQAWQEFSLRRPPLTYLAAATPAGAAAALTVRVNDVRWREADNHVVLGPDDRAYVVEIDDDQKTRIIFGNGENGARPPTGMENIRAVYRSGIGQVGNVTAEQIKLLTTRPLGVKEVINPMRASGGADAESRDSARRTAPLAVMALDRLVSVQDYADFSRTFAGVGKAQAVALPDGRREVIFLTIAGANDIPIDKTSDLYRNLKLALRRAGDPWRPLRIEVRELLALVVIAGVRIDPDYLWEKVAPAIRARLYHTFSFERRDLAQGVAASEVISAIHSVAGVLYVDLDTLETISETEVRNQDLLKEKLDKLAGVATSGNLAGAPGPSPGVFARPAERRDDVLCPAQLAYLDPRVPDTLILKELSA